MPTARFPWWIPLGALVLAAGYLPTLRTPFDFIDDGNLVYPAAAGTSVAGHADIWWQKVRANYDHLGPFRPTLWMHWELTAAACGGDAAAWRFARWVWCGLSAGVLLWLFRELKLPPTAALVAGAAAMWNPYRNEIWTSLTLAEGVAMPYALLALVAARKAAHANRAWPWDVAAAVGVVVALGCKNTFAALIPAMMVLRFVTDDVGVRECWRRNGWRAVMYTAILALPAAHFVYFKRHWHPGQYETAPPSVAQAGRILAGWKGATGLDFLGVGLLAAAVAAAPARRHLWAKHRAGILTAVVLLAAGFVVYLPMAMMSGRYSMPAVWGLDILIAVVLAGLCVAAPGRRKAVAWAAVWGGVGVLAIANAGRQEKFAARARMLWDAVEYVETTAPPGAAVAWVSGDSATGDLNVEEGIHFQWHLFHRGRGDIRVGLIDAAGKPVPRVELPPPPADFAFRLGGQPAFVPGWDDREFAATYWLGRKKYVCHVGRKAAETARR